MLEPGTNAVGLWSTLGPYQKYQDTGLRIALSSRPTNLAEQVPTQGDHTPESSRSAQYNTFVYI